MKESQYTHSHSHSHKLPNITAVRFFLAFFVMIGHIAGFSHNRGFAYFDDWAIFHKGQEAVYMFFALSGFLIIRQLYVEKQTTSTISLKKFYMRRMLRIFPLYYLVLSIGFIYYRIVLPNMGFEFENNYNLIKGIFLGITFFANILATYGPGGIIEILWSLGIEEQFYLFIAPIICLLPKKRIVSFLLLFTILYFAIFISDKFPLLHKYQMHYYYFSLSGLFSILSLKYNSFRLHKILQFFIIAIAVIYFTTSLFTSILSEIAYSCFSLILFALLVTELTKMRINFLENETLKYLGNISYGIYMYHAIVMQFVGLLYLKIIQLQNLPAVLSILLFNVLVIGGTILLSHLSYKYYESYFLRLKKKFKR